MQDLIASFAAWFREPERNPDDWISSDSHVWIMELVR